MGRFFTTTYDDIWRSIMSCDTSALAVIDSDCVAALFTDYDQKPDPCYHRICDYCSRETTNLSQETCNGCGAPLKMNNATI